MTYQLADMQSRSVHTVCMELAAGTAGILEVAAALGIPEVVVALDSQGLDSHLAPSGDVLREKFGSQRQELRTKKLVLVHFDWSLIGYLELIRDRCVNEAMLNVIIA